MLELAITIYRHSTIGKLPKDFIYTFMNYLKELLPNELMYHNPINKPSKLVCNSIIKTNCIYNSKLNTVLISFFKTSLTRKTNGFFLKNVKTTNLSNARRYYTSKKPIIILLTINQFEKNCYINSTRFKSSNEGKN